MSERLFKFFLSEVNRLRLVCQNPECKSVAEVSLDQLRKGHATRECRVCSTRYFDIAEGSISPIARLAQAIEDLEGRTQNVKIEISLPVSE